MEYPAGIKKEELYEEIISQAKALVDPGLDKYANICTLLGLVKYSLDLFWAGTYWVHDDGLKIGPFQGKPACTFIKPGKGACGKAAANAKTVIIDNVLDFPGYIACHEETRSEIVIPGIRNGKVVFVLDADSTEISRFDETDEKYLSGIANIIAGLL